MSEIKKEKKMIPAEVQTTVNPYQQNQMILYGNQAMLNQYQQQVQRMQIQYQHDMNIMYNQYAYEIGRCYKMIEDLHNRLFARQDVETLPEKIEYDAYSDSLYYTTGERINETIKQKNRKYICRGVPIKCTINHFEKKFNREDAFCIEWSNGKNTYIPVNETNLKKLVSAIIVTGASEILCKEPFRDIGRRIFAYITTDQVVKSEVFICYNAGWQYTKDSMVFYSYLSDSSDIDFPDIVGSGRYNNRLYVDEKRKEASNIEDVARRLNVFRNKETGLLLDIFLIYALLQYFFRQNKYHIDKTVLITGNTYSCDSVISAFWQIFNTDTIIVDILTDEKTLLNKLFQHKDDIVLLREKEISDAREQNAKKIMQDIVRSDRYQVKGISYPLESLIAVITETFNLEKNDKTRFVTINIEEDDINEKALIKLDKREIPTFAANFTKYVSEHDLCLAERIEKRYSDERLKGIDRTDSKKLYVILACCYDIFAEYVANVTGEDFCAIAGINSVPEDIIARFVEENEKYSSLQNACEIFKDIFREMLEQELCVIIDNKSASYIAHPDTETVLPVVYLDKNYFYISENDMKDYLEKTKENSKFFNLYIAALAKEGYLNCTYTKYCSRPIIRHPGKKEERRKMLAIKRELIDEIQFD